MKKDLILQEIDKLTAFCNEHDEIRIYGKGVYGLLLYNYLKNRVSKLSGFVVSEEYSSKKEEDTICLSELADRIRRGMDIAIILAVADKHYLSIFENLKNKQVDYSRCYLVPGSIKSWLREKEKKDNEYGEARNIRTYEAFFEDVYKCNIPGQLNLFCHQHLGDTCILVGLKNEIEDYYKKNVNYIVKESQTCIPQMYGVEDYKRVIFDDFFDSNITRGYSEQDLEFFRSDMRERMFSVYPQTHVPFVTAPLTWNVRWEPEWVSLVNSRARMLGMDTTMINPPSGLIEPSEHLMEFAEKEGGWDKIVLVAPEARANPQIPLEYWENIVSKLKKECFTVVCNAMRKDNKLEGTLDLDLSVSDLIALGQRCHEIHSTRSGLCDCLAARGSALHVYYTNDLDREFDYYSLNNNFYLDDPVTEVMLDD